MVCRCRCGNSPRYSNVRDAIAKHVDNEDKNTVAIRDGIQGNPNKTIINESGLYSLVLSSKLPSAKRFKRWVTSEVLPAIRKTGGYHIEELTGRELMAKALIEAQAVLAEKDKRIEEMRPKEIFADAVSASKTSVLVRDLAKVIKQNGVDIGQNRLFDWLRENGYLIKGGSDRNMPTQRAMNMKLFEIKEGTHTNGDGVNITTRTTKVTGKGQVYFINKFLSGSKPLLN